MALSIITPNTNHELIRNWKLFLKHKKFYFGAIDKLYDPVFETALKTYQQSKKLLVDGYIGNKTWFCAIQDGMEVTSSQLSTFPLMPQFLSISTKQECFNTFGTIEYVHEPVPKNFENIRITNDFETKNIIHVHVPQLAKFRKLSKSMIRFHKIGSEQLRAFFNEVEKEKMLSLIRSYGGSYVPRLIRGSLTNLSNHAFGTAFDINVEWNALSDEPAFFGNYGSVRELIPLAHEYGFFWGGHFSRKDGMHFEIAKIL